VGLSFARRGRKRTPGFAVAITLSLLAACGRSAADKSVDAGKTAQSKRGMSMTEAAQPQQGNNEKAPEILIFALRQVAGIVPWGQGPGEIPHRRSDMGGPTDAGYSELLNVAAGSFWVRNGVDGSIFVVDLGNRTTSRVEFEKAVPAAARGGTVWSLGMAQAGDHVALLVGGRERGQQGAGFGVVLCGLSGNPKAFIPLSFAFGVRDVPEHVAVTPAGAIWVSAAVSSQLFSSKGEHRATIPAGGVMLPGGSFLTSGSAPKLYGENGELLGQLAVPKRPEPYWFLAAGPDGAVLAAGGAAALPEALHERVELFDVLLLVESKRELTLQDRITIPAMTLEKPPSGELMDGLPVRSYFPPAGLSFDAAGDIFMLEVTSSGCRFHVLRRIRDGSRGREKFEHPDDLSAGELSIARAEYLARLGRRAEAGPLARLFEGMAWGDQLRHPPDPTAGTASDQVLARLDPSKATLR
jgi:hypothetical protein